MKNTTTIIYISLLCNFSLTYCMELTTPNTNHVTDITLQQLITQVNKSSLHIVNIVKEQAQQNNIELIPQNIGPFLHLDQKTIDELFLNNVENDNLRPLLLSMGANTKALTAEDRNCLWGIRKQKLIIELTNNGAEVDVIDKYKSTPITYLMRYYLASSQDIATARMLFTKSVNPTIHLDLSLLYHILEEFNKKPSLYLEAAELLCDLGINLNDESESYGTPLIKAIKTGCVELVELFLIHNADPNKLNYYKESPLHIAMEKKQFYYHSHTREIIPGIVILLLQSGADPNISYMDGTTMPLHVAVNRKQPEIIKELIIHKAHKHYKNPDGNTAYDLAKRLEYQQDILDLLYVETTEITENSIHDEHESSEKSSQTNEKHCSIQ